MDHHIKCTLILVAMTFLFPIAQINNFRDCNCYQEEQEGYCTSHWAYENTHMHGHHICFICSDIPQKNGVLLDFEHTVPLLLLPPIQSSHRDKLVREHKT